MLTLATLPSPTAQIPIHNFFLLFLLSNTIKMNSGAPTDKNRAPRKVVRPDNWWQQRAAAPAAKNPLSVETVLVPAPVPAAEKAPPVPAKSPLRDPFSKVSVSDDSKRFSTVEGFFGSPEEESKARRDLTPPALRIIKRREAIERKSKASISSTPPELYRSPASSIVASKRAVEDESTLEEPATRKSSVPDYYEDTNFAPAVPTKSALARRPATRIPQPVEKSAEDDDSTYPARSPRPRISRSNKRRLLTARSFSELPVPDDPQQAADLEKAWKIKNRKLSQKLLERSPPRGPQYPGSDQPDFEAWVLSHLARQRERHNNHPFRHGFPPS